MFYLLLGKHELGTVTSEVARQPGGDAAQKSWVKEEEG